MTITIGFKIFAIALGLLVLMAAVAVVTTTLARDVGSQLDFVVDEYIPADGALARANVRAVEQSLHLRRAIISRIETPDDHAAFERHLAAYADAGRKSDADIAEARHHLVGRLQGRGHFTDQVAIAQLDARLALLLGDHGRYETEAKGALAALQRNDHPDFRRRLATVDTLRDDLDTKIDGVRREMLTLADAAADETRRRQNQVISVSLVVMAIAGGLGLLVAGVVTAGVVRPVRRLVHGTRQVEAGALDTVVPVTSRDEIGVLTLAFNQMVGELQVKKRIRDTFSKYVDPRIVENLIDHPAIAGGGGERRVMTVFFCDMKGFTSLSEGLTPSGLVNVINHYLTTMSSAIREQHGIIDKYIGDAIMAFWGPPFTNDEDQARLACLAALDQLRRLEEFRRGLPEVLGIRKNVPDVQMRIGIATGDVVVGNIGSDATKSYTVMGDTVNLASRLEGVGRQYGTQLLIAEETARRTADLFVTREIDAIFVVGKTEPQRIFELMGLKGEPDAARHALRQRYAAALAAYRAQDWDTAQDELEASLTLVPGDGPSLVLLDRVAEFREAPPGAGWNGVWTMTTK